MALSLMLTMSRSGIVAFGLSMLITGWFVARSVRSRSRRIAAAVCLALLLAIAVLWTGPDVVASRFVAPDASDESVVALNNTTRARTVKLQGLRENQDYFVVAWNRDGHGSLASLPPLRSDATGAATVSVPDHGVVALSTRNPAL